MALNQLVVQTSTNVSAEGLAANIQQNLGRANAWQQRPCVIIGGGPSVKAFTDSLPPYKTFALNNAATVLRRPPDYIVMMDAREANAEMDIIKRPYSASTYLLASQVHPRVYEELEAAGAIIRQWHAAGTMALRDLDIKGVGGGATVLTRTVPIAFEMGYRQFHIYGVDSSYANSGDHHAYTQTLNDNQNTIEVFTPHKRTRFVTTGVLAQQAQECVQQWQALEKFGCEFFVYGEGLLPTLWREAKEHRADLDAFEPEKYRRIWSMPLYRRHSPGETALGMLKDALQLPPGARVIDFGCGCGRASARLVEDGYDVTAIDFADNCLDDEAREKIGGRFVLANLWDGVALGNIASSDYAICNDVMEHIPTEKVDAVLANIGKLAKKAAFTICFEPDVHGKHINETLHLTVRTADWWTKKLGEHFGTVRQVVDGLFICEGYNGNH